MNHHIKMLYCIRFEKINATEMISAGVVDHFSRMIVKNSVSTAQR